MDTTTKNPRVIAIHLARVNAHLAEAFRELNRIDASSLPGKLHNSVIKMTAKVWADALALAEAPVKTPEKKSRKAKDAPAEKSAKAAKPRTRKAKVNPVVEGDPPVEAPVAEPTPETV